MLYHSGVESKEAKPTSSTKITKLHKAHKDFNIFVCFMLAYRVCIFVMQMGCSLQNIATLHNILLLGSNEFD